MSRDFKCIFIDQYVPLDSKNVAQDKLQELWQCGTVQEFITYFDNVVVALHDLATKDTIHIFIYGLKPWLKGFVKAQV